MFSLPNRSRSFSALVGLTLVFGLGACGSHEPPAGSADPSAAPPPSTSPPPGASAMLPASAAPVTSTEVIASATASASASATASAAPSAAPLPDVEVKNIGMHIGGGPNDAVTKGPVKRSVEPHFDELRACFAKVSDPKKGGDVSIDLHIEREGGKAKVTKYRSALSGDGFEDCVKAVFESIDFERPKGGTTNVSYGLGFRPKR